MNGIERPVELITRRPPQPFLEGWRELADGSHPWFKWRMAAFMAQLRQLDIRLDQRLRALEVGCGTGVLRSQFESVTGWSVDGADLDYEGLVMAGSSPARGRTLYYDILDEAEEFVGAYDVLILYDVLEHIEDARPFIKSLLRHLKPRGLLLVNVPAVPLLYSNFDRAVGHVRRYDKRGLSREFDSFDVEIVDMCYWGVGLLPFLLLRKLMLSGRRHAPPEEVQRSGFKSPHPLVDQFLGLLMRGESRLLKTPPIGASLLMACRKGASDAGRRPQAASHAARSEPDASRPGRLTSSTWRRASRP